MSHDSVRRSKRPRSAVLRILRAAAFVFFVGWLVSAALLSILDASRKEYLWGGFLFFGSFLSWVVAILQLRKKGPDNVEALLQDISEDEGKELEESLSSTGSFKAEN